MVEDKGHLLGDQVLVDRHRHATQGLRRGDRPIESRPVVADDRQLVAAREPQPLEPGRERLHLGRSVGPAPALPDAVILLAHRRPVGALAGVRQQQFREGVEWAGAGSGPAGNRRCLCRCSGVARHPASPGASNTCLIGAPQPPMPDRAIIVKALPALDCCSRRRSPTLSSTRLWTRAGFMLFSTAPQVRSSSTTARQLA